MSTKNLGQVSGVHIGTTPPSNTILIWYDSTPSQTTISSTTYSELTNMARNTGLSVGEWFQITDRSNALALAVTSTKVQYCDTIGNILIDDLGTNIQYHVTSSNLSIDDVVGVFDEVNKKLVFQFNEYTPDYTADDYILGKIKRNNVWSLAKYKLSSFLSKITGNSITWNGGFFFNFSQAIQNILNKKGGVVGKDAYDKDKAQLTQSINNVGKENQSIIQNVNKALQDATSPNSIYDKRVQSALETGNEPIDAARGDRLYTILSKFQTWINKFKYTTGISISKNFTVAENRTSINNNDTAETAFAKVQKYLDDYSTGDNIKVSSKTLEPPSKETAEITNEDSLAQAISKLKAYSENTYFLGANFFLIIEDDKIQLRFPVQLKDGDIVDVSFLALLRVSVAQQHSQFRFQIVYFENDEYNYSFTTSVGVSNGEHIILVEFDKNVCTITNLGTTGGGGLDLNFSSATYAVMTYHNNRKNVLVPPEL